MNTSQQTALAAQFRALHAPGKLLVLPNAWDAASARLVEDCGASAIATSSAAVAWSKGYPDGEMQPRDGLVSLVRDIVRVAKIPVSADSEMGYSDDPASVAEFVVALARAGAAGINLEDGTAPPSLLAAKIGAIRKALSRAGFDVFVNARTDVYLKSLVPAERAFEETLERGRLYREAGADGFFVPWVPDMATMRKTADAIELPLNVLIRSGLPPVSELKAAGVRRLSAGAGTARAAYGTAKRATLELLREGHFDVMMVEAQNCPNMNALLGGK